MESNPQKFAQRIEQLALQAEAFLFSEGAPITFKKLSQLLHANDEEVSRALTTLAERLEGRGISIIRTDTEAALSVSPQASDAVKDAQARELGREIGDAGLEVLAILLYRGPSTRAQIDYVRGVNTSSTIRTLLMRGLLERTTNPTDSREYLYRPTTELLAHIGVREGKELPEYAKIASELAAFDENVSPFDETHDGSADTAGNATGRETA